MTTGPDYRRKSSKTLGPVLILGTLGLAACSDGSDSGVERQTQAQEPASYEIVRVPFASRTLGNQIFRSFEGAILETNYERGYHVMRLSDEHRSRLAGAGLTFEVDPSWKPHQRASAGERADGRELPGFPCYDTVEQTFALAEGLTRLRPDLARWVDVGDSWERSAGYEGYDMNVLVLTNDATTGDKPKLFLGCAMHARELATAPLCLDFAEHLVTSYGVDADATWILDHHEIHLLLQANPDGRKHAEVGDSWRKNTNENYCGPESSSRGADLNRNFAFNWGCCNGSSGSECTADYRGPEPESEPEVQAISAYLRGIFPDQRGPDLDDAAPEDATGILIDVHSYSELVLWPWGHVRRRAPNGRQLQTLGRKFAYFNGYQPQQSIGLYPTDGAIDDFCYGELGVASYTFEIGTEFFQSCTAYEGTLLPENLPALIYAAKVVRAPYVTPAGPDTYDLALSDSSVPVGTAVLLQATVNDTRYSRANGSERTQTISAAEYTVDVPPWMADPAPAALPLSAADGRFDGRIERVQATVDTTGLGEGRHLLFVRARDAAGKWGAVSAAFLDVE